MAGPTHRSTPPTDLDAFARETGIGRADTSAGLRRPPGPRPGASGNRGPLRDARAWTGVAGALLIGSVGWAINGALGLTVEAHAREEAALQAMHARAARASVAADRRRIRADFPSQLIQQHVDGLVLRIGRRRLVRSVTLDSDRRLSVVAIVRGKPRIITGDSFFTTAAPWFVAAGNPRAGFPLGRIDPSAPGRIVRAATVGGRRTSDGLTSLTLSADPANPSSLRWLARWSYAAPATFVADLHGGHVHRIHDLTARASVQR